MSEEATLVAPAEQGEGKAPERTSAFNTMAKQIEAAMKGTALPDEPKAPPKPAEPPKPVEQPAKPADLVKTEDKAKTADPTAAPTPEELNPFSPARNWKLIHEKMKAHDALQKDFEKAKSEREALLKQLEEAKKTITATAAPAQTPPELEDLRKTLQTEKEAKAKIEQELKILALERAPEFREHYQKRFDAAISQAQTAVPDEAKAKVADLVKLPPTPYRKQLLTELMVDLNEYDRSVLAVAITDMDRARAERDQALKDNETNYKRLQELEATKAAEQQKANESAKELAIRGVLDAARQQFDAFKTVEGNEKHNEFVKRAEERVTRFFRGQLDPSEMALLPVIASDYEVVRSQRDTLLSELEQAKKTISTYESANPVIGSGSKKTDAKPKTFKDKFLEQWNPGA